MCFASQANKKAYTYLGTKSGEKVGAQQGWRPAYSRGLPIGRFGQQDKSRNLENYTGIHKLSRVNDHAVILKSIGGE